MSDKNPAVSALSFEEALMELEGIVTRLESGEGTLDDAITAYERGSNLKQHCQKKLDQARLKVEKIRVPEGGGEVQTTEFET